MISPFTVISSVLPVFLLLIAGAVLRRTGVIHSEHDHGILRVIFSVMFPCFVLDKMLGAEILRSGPVVVWGIVLGFCLAHCGLLLGWLVGRGLGLERGTGRRTFTLATGLQNYGYTAIPVVQVLWGASAAGLLFVHNIGVELCVWSTGVMIMSGERGISWKRLANGPMIAAVTGIVLVVLRLDNHVTGPVRTAMSMIGSGAFPLAILITGASIMDLAIHTKPELKIGLGSILVRLILAPICYLTAAKFLPIATELKQILVVQAAMPAAMTPILLARLYGGRPSVAVQTMVVTTTACLVTLPIIVTWGIRWMDLKPLLP
ncbi:AEC family transporter [Luteolibacter pohnpeiensis]|uniref:AEC family transporter n=1 Tax=Luteolibacter pohnpeiensis TaxID=454153 RepID=A0A934VVW6_9BACT|nr:AEC family transporter [Luteolibacter pohnpeiensis]MBK1882650.1 AEC family transporter [Luteolibacter pohnpeiensis]